MAALLTIEAANTDKLAMYLGECRDLGVPILPPDINTSQLAFTVEKEGVRFGLCAVKNVGEGAILSMLDVRKELGRIDSLYTLCEQVDQRLVNKRPLESLVKAGAFDSLAEQDRCRDAARPSLRRRRQGDRTRQPPSAQPAERHRVFFDRLRTTKHRWPSRCPTRRRGPRRSSSRSRRKRSAST